MRLVERLPRPLVIFFTVIGPGFITAMVDNDAGGIYTYSQAGALFGYMLLWTLPPIALLLVVTQEMNARMGAVTGKGLSDLIREEFGLRITFALMTAARRGEPDQRDGQLRRRRERARTVPRQQVHLRAAGGRRGLVPRGEGDLPQRREDLPLRLRHLHRLHHRGGADQPGLGGLGPRVACGRSFDGTRST